MGTRRRFTKEYKQESVQLVTRRGVTVAQAARDFRTQSECASEVGAGAESGSGARLSW